MRVLVKRKKCKETAVAVCEAGSLNCNMFEIWIKIQNKYHHFTSVDNMNQRHSSNVGLISCCCYHLTNWCLLCIEPVGEQSASLSCTTKSCESEISIAACGVDAILSAHKK